MSMNARQVLRTVLEAALQSVDGRSVVADALRQRIEPFGGIVAIGKAASSMLEGALDARPATPALLITKDGHVSPTLRNRTGVGIIEAGHPLPDARSLHAGRRLMDFIAAATADRPVLFLLSGGASSLVEVLPEGVTLADWRRVNAWLLGSGLDIHAMNAVRKRLSCIKGGRLLERLGGRRAVVLMISDVPGDDPASIGSGPLSPCVDAPLPDNLPDWMRAPLDAAPPQPDVDDPRWASVEARILAGNATALDGAVRAASCLGLPIHRHGEPLCGDAAEAGARLARQSIDGPPGLHLWGGETTVALPEHPGRGGRNQHLALSAALLLAGRFGITLLAAGTDGSDGPTKDAGACVDGGTVALMRAQGFDPQEALCRADSGAALAAADALIRTGPTGTNVMDVVLALVEPP
ncbi:MAG: glycerate kinase type-2 family protein [Pseudomonadota bacterium]